MDNDDSDVDVHNSKRIKNKERKKQTIALQTNDQQIHPCEERKRKKDQENFILTNKYNYTDKSLRPWVK